MLKERKIDRIQKLVIINNIPQEISPLPGHPYHNMLKEDLLIIVDNSIKFRTFNRILYYVDGDKYKPIKIDSPTQGLIRDIFYINNIWVTVSDIDIFISTDGKMWNKVSGLFSRIDVVSIYNNMIFIGDYSQRKGYTTTDFINWSEGSLDINPCYNQPYGSASSIYPNNVPIHIMNREEK